MTAKEIFSRCPHSVSGAAEYVGPTLCRWSRLPLLPPLTEQWQARRYGRQGQHYMALRQFHLCAEALERELDVAPAPATVQLHERIRRHEQT